MGTSFGNFGLSTDESPPFGELLVEATKFRNWKLLYYMGHALTWIALLTLAVFMFLQLLTLFLTLGSSSPSSLSNSPSDLKNHLIYAGFGGTIAMVILGQMMLDRIRRISLLPDALFVEQIGKSLKIPKANIREIKITAGQSGFGFKDAIDDAKSSDWHDPKTVVVAYIKDGNSKVHELAFVTHKAEEVVRKSNAWLQTVS